MATKDRFKKPILLACLAVGALTCLCASLIALFAWHMHASEIRYTERSEYPKAHEYITAVYGSEAAHLPAAIPPNATDVYLDAFISDWFPTPDGPWIWLSFSLPPDETAAELARLRSLGPVTETQRDRWPSWFTAGTEATKPDRSGCIAFTFDADALGEQAWVDPVNGKVGYHVGGY